MRKKVVLIIALIIIVSIPISYLLWSMYLRLYGANKYERTINRDPANLQEAIALDIAEYSNYSRIFDKPKLTAPQDPQSYIWADFIDAEVLHYYNSRYDNFTQQTWSKPKQINFRYEAKVHTWNQIHAVYVLDPENSYNSKIQVQSLNGSVLLESDGNVESAHWNGSDHQIINPDEIDIFIPRSYVVEMEFEYEEYYAPLAAFSVHINQLIIIDENFVAELLCIQSLKTIS